VGKLGEKEIDFVCEKSGEIKYLQVAYLLPDHKAKDREFGNLLEIKDNYPKFVISMDEMPGGKYQGIEHLNIIDFLGKYF
jgi:predicted AAA+ superfamily ATPase